ncbi:hypothetical protein KKB58_01580, partial [Patescibacteria group bacterium]|nr:hypothetical protein [Patescibacteria group bacterium]
RIEKQIENPNAIKNEEAIRILELIKDRSIGLKVESSDVQEKGSKVVGKLEFDIKIGSPISLDNGEKTSIVTNINCIRGGKCFVQTKDAVYELTIE